MDIFNEHGELVPEAIDVLVEIGNVSVGTAVMPIGNLREMEIRISSPKVVTVQQDIISEIAYDPNQIMVGVTTRMENNFDGSILFLLKREFVRNTVQIMMEETYSDDQLMEDEDCVSAIQEIVNYMTAGYAKVIGSYLQKPVYISAANIGMDKVSNILKEFEERMKGRIDKIVYVDTEFTIFDENGQKTDESGQVLIFPEEKSIEAFMEIML